LIEAITHYAGWPTGMTAIALLKEIVEEAGQVTAR
jgi:alkylhydroperoxidase/carboxymuconolactone decarboxylase family protein YurZ